MSENNLGKFLAEVSNWRWDDFVRAEKDKSYTSRQAMIFALVRSCAMQNLQAIKLSVNRLDGKLATPLKVEYPKVYYLYPNAAVYELKDVPQVVNRIDIPEEELETSALIRPDMPEPEITENDLPSLSIRQTVAKMADFPRDTPDKVARDALETEMWLRNEAPKPFTVPLVKSVVAAHLLILAQKRNIEALGEVFDQIDGKLAETIKLLGDDLFITSYAMVAPEGAYVNDKGILQIEASQVQDMWATKLGKVIDESENI